MHLPQGELRKRSIAASKPWLKPGVHRVIGFVKREMGLMVRRGNPLHIGSLDRLLDPEIRFVNRDPDSGTRLLFEQRLAQHGIEGARINGYEHGEFTHAAVAAYVASGMADVAFGVEAAARQFDLDFVRLVTEDYFFVCRKEILELDAVKRVLSIMKGEAFYAAISKVPGYSVNEAGSIKTVRDVFRTSG
jgi:molybdate-binding protein